MYDDMGHQKGVTMTDTTGPAVSLREVTKENLREILRLKVHADQERFVASNAISFAQAYFDRDAAWFRAIYADDTPVGFVMMHVQPSESKYYLWRFMIDHRYQKSGYGARALEQVIDDVRQRPGARELTTSVVPGDGTPGPFYEKLGFVYTGELDDDERVMRKLL
jgi:diamine N-acetyltransferase